VQISKKLRKSSKNGPFLTPFSVFFPQFITQTIYLCLFNKEISYQKRKRHEFRQNLSQLAGLRREYQDFNRILTKDWHIPTFVSKQHFLEFDKKAERVWEVSSRADLR